MSWLDAPTIIGIALCLANVLLARRYLRLCAQADRAELAAANEWRAALASAHIAHAQAKAIGEASTLLCADCCAIVGGFYESDAGPRTREWLAEQGRDT